MDIYILVEVSYDHYRFQENLMASSNKKDLLDFAKSKHPTLPVYDYVYESDPIVETLWNVQSHHLWIEKFPKPPNAM